MDHHLHFRFETASRSCPSSKRRALLQETNSSRFGKNEAASKLD